MRYLTMATMAVVAAFGLAACGSSKSGSSKEIASADFAQKADAICTATNQQRKTFGTPPQFNPATAKPAQIKSSAGYLGKEATATESEISRVYALGTPKDEPAKTAWPKLHTSLTSVTIPSLKQAAADAQKGDGKAYAGAFQKLAVVNSAQSALEKQIGLKVCGQG